MPLPSDGYGRPRLPYPYSYVIDLDQPTQDYASGQTSNRRPVRNAFTLCLTDQEMLEIVSALQAGADLIYPDRWQEVIDPFLAAREHPNNPNWSQPCAEEIILSDPSTIGSVVFWPNGNTIPDGFWPCLGGNVTEAMFPGLIEAAAAGNWVGLSGTAPNRLYQLPDMTDRFALGDTGSNPRQTGGEEDHTLTISEMPAHDHAPNLNDNGAGLIDFTTRAGGTFRSNGWRVSVTSLDADERQTGTPGNNFVRFDATTSTGDDAAHNNMPPYMRGIWIMRVKPIEFNITQFFDVQANNCVISKTVNGQQSQVVDIKDCIASSRESIPEFDRADDQPDTKNDDDCIWGGASAAVDYIISNALELLDALEAAANATEGFFEFISTLGWWIPSARAIEVFEFVANVSIAVARLELENEPTQDGWKCDLFCRIKANGGALSQQVYQQWLGNDICPNPATCPPGSLAFLASAELTPAQWLFNRYALSYSDDCSSGHTTLCDCEKCFFIDDFGIPEVDIKRGNLQGDGTVTGEFDNGGYFIVIEVSWPFPVSVTEVQVDWDRASTSSTADLDVQVPAGPANRICQFDSDPVGRRTDTCNIGGISAGDLRIVIDQPAQTRVYSLRVTYEGGDILINNPCP